MNDQHDHGAADQTSTDPRTGEPQTGEPEASAPGTGEPQAGESRTGEPPASEPGGGETRIGESDTEQGSPRVRTRTRSRSGPSGGTDSGDASTGEASDGDGVRRTRVRERTTSQQADDDGPRTRPRRAGGAASSRTRVRRSGGGRPTDGRDAAEETDSRADDHADAADAAGAAPRPDDTGSSDERDDTGRPGRQGDGQPRRRRSRRRRRGRRGSGAKRAQGPGNVEQQGGQDRDRQGTGKPKGKQSGGRSAPAKARGTAGKDQEADRSDRDTDSGRSGKSRSRRSGRSGGRRSSTSVSDETRRAIADGPPRRMLVTEGPERTEIAVLEERDLVEHYVTRKEDVSYVGNIYLGRVQNVLPGMEAAFVDIGKGRNGVLYAGEVDYDAEDLEGEVPRIEQTLKPGQPVLVQVTKDPMGTKGARLTQHLSIAGRYCVLAPGDGMLGISRKLPDEERDRLRKILKSVRPDGYGLIVRTAAEGASRDQLEADVQRLVRLWEGVQQRAGKAKPLSAVYEEPSLVIRVIRDVFGPEYTDLIIDSPELVDKVREYLGDVSPEMLEKVSLHTGDPLFAAYEVTNQVRRALEKKVWLASGGYLIIEKTEAMWVIDVNTGRFVGKSNLEETVLKNNLEAADEIARQLRLRDMGGIIVIDFVDMMVPANREEVLKRFRRELARDKTKSRVMEISKLGLVQMTRKNVSQGLTETFTTACDCCDGRGAKIIDALK